MSVRTYSLSLSLLASSSFSFGGVASTIAGANASVRSIAAFHDVYSDSALLGVYANVSADASSSVHSGLSAAFASLAAGKVDAAALKAAKAYAKRQLAEAANSGASLAAQLSSSGSITDLASKIDGVSAASVGAAMKQFMAKPETLVLFGDTSNL